MPGTRGAVPVPLRDGTRDVTQLILDTLENQQAINSTEAFPQIPQDEIKAALDRLKSRLMLEYDAVDEEQVHLTEEGQSIADTGSHEWKVWDAIRKAGKIEMKDLVSQVGESAKVGQGNAMKNKWIKKEGSALVVATDSVTDLTRETLQQAAESKTISDSKLLADYRKRKLITLKKVITYNVRKGPKYAKEIPVEHTDLTAEMLMTGEWQTANFKPYNFKALGANQNAGALHPINKVRKEFRDIFFHLGFVEMPTSRYVESGFWNFDGLFVPQQHPARDLQDTFYVSDPPKADRPRPDEEMEKTMEQMEAGLDKITGTVGSREVCLQIKFSLASALANL